jgi:hypothetical protein
VQRSHESLVDIARPWVSIASPRAWFLWFWVVVVEGVDEGVADDMVEVVEVMGVKSGAVEVGWSVTRPVEEIWRVWSMIIEEEATCSAYILFDKATATAMTCPQRCLPTSSGPRHSIKLARHMHETCSRHGTKQTQDMD